MLLIGVSSFSYLRVVVVVVVLGLQGFLEHSSTKCIGPDGADKLVVQAECNSGEQVFYKQAYSSHIIHVVSGKCIKTPESDGAVSIHSYASVFLSFLIGPGMS